MNKSFDITRKLLKVLATSGQDRDHDAVAALSALVTVISTFDDIEEVTARICTMIIQSMAAFSKDEHYDWRTIAVIAIATCDSSSDPAGVLGGIQALFINEYGYEKFNEACSRAIKAQDERKGVLN